MENYFNYFTEIEEHFQRRRGTLLLLSPLDWALMETWKDAGIPLEAVLRGIDATFEKWERRPAVPQGEWPRLLRPGSAGFGRRDEGSRGGRVRQERRRIPGWIRPRSRSSEAQRRATRTGAIAGEAQTLAKETAATLRSLGGVVVAGTRCQWKIWSED